MFARVSTFEGTAEQVDQMTRYADEHVLPVLRGIDGFAGALGLADRASGKVVAVILWQTEDHMRASEEAANRLRSETAEAVSEKIVDVERYEVAFAEVEGTQP